MSFMVTEVTIYGKISCSYHQNCVVIRVCLTTKMFSLIFYTRRIKWKWKHTPHLRIRWNFYFLQVGNFLYLFSNFKEVDYNKKHNLFEAKKQVLYFRRIVQSKLKVSELKNRKDLIKKFSGNLFSGLLFF